MKSRRAGSKRLAFQGLRLSKSKAFGRQKGHTENPLSLAPEYVGPIFLPKVKIEYRFGRTISRRAPIEAIVQRAKTEKIGDGQDFCQGPIEQTIRIRYVLRALD